MQTHALQNAATLIPATLKGGSAPFPQGVGSFGSHLDRAMEKGGAAHNEPLASQSKSTLGDAPGHTGLPVANAMPGAEGKPRAGAAVFPAASAAPLTPAYAPAPVILVAMSGGPGSSTESGTVPTSAASTASAPASSSKGLSWLMSMIPDVFAGQPGQTVGAAIAKSAAGDANPPDAAKKLSDAAAVTSQSANTNSNPAANSTSATAPKSSPSVKGDSATASPRDAAEIQAAAQSLENSGLALFSKTTSADGGALPSVFQSHSSGPAAASRGMTDSPSPAASASAPHLQPAAGTASQVPAKDIAAGNTAGTAQAQATHADASPAVKPTAPATGDGAKNGASQDSAGKSANPGQTASAPGATATTGAASAATNAVQAAANGFPAALSQSAAGGSPSSHAGTPTQGAATQTTVGDRVAAAMDSPVNAPGNPVNAASLLQTPQGRSEMRVAVQTENMGTLQLHAVLDGGRVGASISVVGHEAHTLLSNELPALQQVLTDQNLRIDHLTVINSPMSSGAGAGDGRNFQSGDFNHPQGRDTRWYSSVPIVASGAGEARAPADLRRRLSVRA